MKIETKLHNPFKKANLILVGNRNKKINSLPIDDNNTTYNIDLNTVKYIYYEVSEYITEKIKLHDNQNVFSIYPNKKIGRPEVSILSNTNDYGNLTIDYIEDKDNLDYRKDHKKKVVYYYSPDFNSNKPVELLICFDAQNIFDIRKLGNYTTNNDSYRGWQIETSIVNSHKNMLVVGIFNDDNYREQELTPNDLKENDFYRDNLRKVKKQIPGMLNGKLDNLGQFIVNNIIEPIKAKYSICKTGICGASCGGLASHYLALKYPNAFDYSFVFSSASGLLRTEYWRSIYNKLNTEYLKTRFYIYNGGKGLLEKNLKAGNEYNIFILSLNSLISNNNIRYYLERDYEHNEISWRYAFSFLYDIESKKD